jgi:hypothetical protein
MKTLYNLTKSEAKKVLLHFDNDTEKLALALYNTGKAITLESAINKSIKIKNFAE